MNLCKWKEEVLWLSLVHWWKFELGAKDFQTGLEMVLLQYSVEIKGYNSNMWL